MTGYLGAADWIGKLAFFDKGESETINRKQKDRQRYPTLAVFKPVRNDQITA